MLSRRVLLIESILLTMKNAKILRHIQDNGSRSGKAFLPEQGAFPDGQSRRRRYISLGTKLNSIKASGRKSFAIKEKSFYQRIGRENRVQSQRCNCINFKNAPKNVLEK